MDFSHIQLNRKERFALRDSRKRKIPISRAPRLLRLKLTQNTYTCTPGNAPKTTDFMEISTLGQDYLAYYQQSRRDFWMVNAWIPIIVAFLTTVTTNYILPKLPQILQWLSSIFAGLS